MRLVSEVTGINSFGQENAKEVGRSPEKQSCGKKTSFAYKNRRTINITDRLCVVSKANLIGKAVWVAMSL
jgi:hypothetical protein